MLFPLAISSKAKKEHMQKYARRYFAEKLRAHSFVSYHDEDLSWYRVVNGEVLQSVFLFYAFPMIPLLPYIGYGMTPLFIETPVPQDVYVQSGLRRDELMTAVCMDPPRHQVAEDIWIQSTWSDECGAEKLDEEVFPILDRIHSISDVYEFYKSRHFETVRINQEQGWDYHINVSDHFVDMAIFQNDKQMYPYCQERIERMLKRVPRGKYWTKQDAARTMLRYRAIAEGQRDMYLEELEKRKKAFEKKLKNKVGI